MTGSTGASKALRAALDAEQEGLAMYRTAADRTVYPMGRLMFLSLAEDERSHIKMIERIAGGMGMASALEEARNGTPTERMKNALSDLKDVVMDDLSVCADELEALRIAQDIEKISNLAQPLLILIQQLFMFQPGQAVQT